MGVHFNVFFQINRTLNTQYAYTPSNFHKQSYINTVLALMTKKPTYFHKLNIKY